MNIRQKVLAGMAIVLIAMLAIGFVSFSSLRKVERKQRFVAIADDLSNLILEVRRYEKNYLLYGSLEDLEENRKYIAESADLLQKIKPDVQDLKVAPLLGRIEQTLSTYQRGIEILAAARQPDTQPGDPQWEESLRNSGKQLVDLSNELVTFERDNILSILNNLKAQLISSLGVFLFIGAFLIPMVSFKIMRPLKTIEDTTLRIAKGDFRPIPVRRVTDETQRVIEAFNRMVQELEKRQDQLVQAKKLSSLGTLTSGIAHQLNNPLNNISTSCQILIEDLDKLLRSLEASDREFVRKMLGNIEQEVHRARDIVRGLLEFSREKEFCLLPTPLEQVVERSIKLISSQIPPGIRIIRSIPGDLSLNMDAQRMQQVFLNLIENAVHAIGDTNGEIRIGAQHNPSGREVLITVEDTGAGIPEKELASIFDPFFTTKDVGSGTGLGLSIVYGIVQKHNGSIGVESEIGSGTRFKLRLPIEIVC